MDHQYKGEALAFGDPLRSLPSSASPEILPAETARGWLRSHAPLRSAAPARACRVGVRVLRMSDLDNNNYDNDNDDDNNDYNNDHNDDKKKSEE